MELVYDPRTGIRVSPHHRSANGQCAATELGYWCTAKRGHGGWHTAYGPDRSKGTLHIWLDDVIWSNRSGPKRQSSLGQRAARPESDGHRLG